MIVCDAKLILVIEKTIFLQKKKNVFNQVLGHRLKFVQNVLGRKSGFNSSKY